MISINYLIVITVKLSFIHTILSSGQTIKLLMGAYYLFSVDISRIQQIRCHSFLKYFLIMRELKSHNTVSPLPKWLQRNFERCKLMATFMNEFIKLLNPM